MSKLTLFHNVYRATEVSDDQAQDLVLLHGWGLHSIVWDEVMPELLKKHRVTVIDLPGMGQSPMPGGHYNMDYIVEHVLTVAPVQAIWLGWSLGGMVAAKVAASHPERVSRLITVASSPKFMATEDWPYAMPEKVLEGFYQVFLEDSEGTLIRFLALQCKGSDRYKEDVRQLKDMLYFCGLPATKALRSGLEILRDVDLREDIKNITVTSLHIFGEKDHLVPVAVAEKVSELYGDQGKVAVLQQVAHVPHITCPNIFVEAVNDFLQAAV